jgi:transposase
MCVYKKKRTAVFHYTSCQKKFPFDAQQGNSIKFICTLDGGISNISLKIIVTTHLYPKKGKRKAKYLTSVKKPSTSNRENILLKDEGVIMEIVEVPKNEYENLQKEYEALKAEYEALKGLVVALTNEIVELKTKLNKNSKNSNNPPSSDGPKKGTVKNSRAPSGKKTGGQPGREGNTKLLAPSPETVVVLKLKEECDCGGQIILNSENYTVRQVFDVTLPKTIVTEYRANEGTCKECGKVHKASFPEGVSGVVSYGDNLQAMVTYLNTYHLIPLKRTTELVKDLFGIDMSQGAVVSSSGEAYDKLESTEERIKEEIIGSDAAGFDETGMRAAGKNHWMHVASTDTCTVYSVHEKRGWQAMDRMGILPLFTGTAIHDHLKSYYHYLCAHGECNQHHMRHLRYLSEDLGCGWAGEMLRLLVKIKKHVDLTKLFNKQTHEANSLEQEDIEIYEYKYRKILDDARADMEKFPIESQRMIKRLSKYEQETLLFMYDFSIPFTNNLSERDLRMPKAKQKISGGFRTKEGADAFARIRGFVSTVKKRGKNVMDGMAAIFKGEAQKFLYPESSK